MEKNKEANTNDNKKPITVVKKKSGSALKFVQKYYYYFTIIEIILILGLGYWFLIQPEINEMLSNTEAAQTLDEQSKEELRTYKNNIDKMSKILAAYNSLTEEEIEKINNTIPDDREVKEIFTQIYNIVKSSGLILSSIEVVKDSGAEVKTSNSRTTIRRGEVETTDQIEDLKASNLELELQIEGVNYIALKSLLNSIENNVRIMNVQSISYNPKDEKAELIIKSYYLKN